MGRAAVEPFSIARRGVIMAPESGNASEVEGVLNPATVRGRDGQLYLFPRLVAKGNYSRIGVARVLFDDFGEPAGVERLGFALEPEEPYEKNGITGGGVEDPRITYFEPLDRYLMTYTAFSTDGPRVAVAESTDLMSWKRLGLVSFANGFADLNSLDNKDAVFFPRLVPGPNGRPALALIHRPRFPGSMLLEMVAGAGLHQRKDDRPSTWDGSVRSRFKHESLWISYSELTDPLTLGPFREHHRLLSPRAWWERIKVGAGTPPILTRHGWLSLYHGVGVQRGKTKVRYSAGVMVLDAQHPEKLRYRSRRTVLSPGNEEQAGIVPDVVFPTGVDQRVDLGQPDRVDVYFGMADDRIGVGILNVPATLPDMSSSRAESTEEEAA